MEEHVRFQVGDIALEGLLFRPANEPRAAVVVCHPHPLYGGDMHNNVVAALVKGLQDSGLATLRFNFRGVGASGGHHDDGRGEVDDVRSAVTCLIDRCPSTTIAVAGYSFGSIVGLKAGAGDHRVQSLIGVALPIARRDASFLRAVTKPKLLICGDRDEHCPISKLEMLVAEIPEPKSLQLIAGADHFFWGEEDRVAQAAAGFLSNVST